jgi:ubiquinone/menaquinone biosynthesis C-methylase UbiE
MEARCKICQSSDLAIVAHTARCKACGVLLFYPYPDMEAPIGDGEKDKVENWYARSSFYNHCNFTEMLRFTMDESCKGKTIDILDYGGGGGQFALVCKSHFPDSRVYIADICDDALMEQWRPFNIQIPFMDFERDERRFDFIFLNDVFEHVSDPLALLKQLSCKLKENGKMFIDTPRQFWIYPLSKAFFPSLHVKILKGTVSKFHLQIWSYASFHRVVSESGLKIDKYSEKTEYTMPANHYLGNMGIRSSFIRFVGWCFYRNARFLARNKIVCVLSK